LFPLADFRSLEGGGVTSVTSLFIVLGKVTLTSFILATNSIPPVFLALFVVLGKITLTSFILATNSIPPVFLAEWEKKVVARSKSQRVNCFRTHLLAAEESEVFNLRWSERFARQVFSPQWIASIPSCYEIRSRKGRTKIQPFVFRSAPLDR